MRLLIATIIAICLAVVNFGRAQDCSKPISPKIAHLVRQRCFVDGQLRELSTFECEPGYEFKSNKKSKTFQTFHGAIYDAVIECIPIGCLLKEMPVKLQPDRDNNLRYFKSLCKKAMLDGRCLPDESYVEFRCKPGFISTQTKLFSNCSHNSKWTPLPSCRKVAESDEDDDDFESKRLDLKLFSAIRFIEDLEERGYGNNKTKALRERLNSNHPDSSRLLTMFKRLLAVEKLSEMNERYISSTPDEENQMDRDHLKLRNQRVSTRVPEKFKHYQNPEKAPQNDSSKSPVAVQSLGTTQAAKSSTPYSTKASFFETSTILQDAGDFTSNIQPNSTTSLESSANKTYLNESDSILTELGSWNLSDSISNNSSPDNAKTSTESFGLPKNANSPEDGRLNNEEINLNSSNEYQNRELSTAPMHYDDYLEQILHEAIQSLKEQNINYYDMIDSLLTQTNESNDATDQEQETKITLQTTNTDTYTPIQTSESKNATEQGQETTEGNFEETSTTKLNDTSTTIAVKQTIEEDLSKLMTTWDNVDLQTLFQIQTTSSTDAHRTEKTNEDEQNFITASTLSLLRSLPKDLDQYDLGLDYEDIDGSLSPEQRKFLNDLWLSSKKSILRNLRRQRLVWNRNRKKVNKVNKSSNLRDSR